MKAINCRVIPVAGYVINVWNLGKGDLEEQLKLYYGEKDFMEDNQMMRDYIPRETKVTEEFQRTLQ